MVDSSSWARRQARRALLEKARRAGAYEGFLEWATLWDGEAPIPECRLWEVAEHLGPSLSPAQVAEVARYAPAAAARHLAGRLTPAQRVSIAGRVPDAARHLL